VATVSLNLTGREWRKAVGLYHVPKFSSYYFR